jgi:hypothetical protein
VAAKAHELNLVEPVWSHMNRSLANLTKHSISQLTALIKTRVNGCGASPPPSMASSPGPPGWTSHRFAPRH